MYALSDSENDKVTMKNGRYSSWKKIRKTGKEEDPENREND